MERSTLRQHCLRQPGAFEDFPFGPEVAVYKVGGKMFALIPVDVEGATISLKCDPTWAEILRQTYPAVTPGYHLNKNIGTQLSRTTRFPEPEVIEMIEHSYKLVVKSLPKKVREELEHER